MCTRDISVCFKFGVSPYSMFFFSIFFVNIHVIKFELCACCTDTSTCSRCDARTPYTTCWPHPSPHRWRMPHTTCPICLSQCMFLLILTAGSSTKAPRYIVGMWWKVAVLRAVDAVDDLFVVSSLVPVSGLCFRQFLRHICTAWIFGTDFQLGCCCWWFWGTLFCSPLSGCLR